jgi:hypothetical protein
MISSSNVPATHQQVAREYLTSKEKQMRSPIAFHRSFRRLLAVPHVMIKPASMSMATECGPDDVINSSELHTLTMTITNVERVFLTQREMVLLFKQLRIC